MTTPFALLATPLIAWAVAALATWLMIRVGIADPPNELRKAHTELAPTAGGVAMGLGAGCGVLFATQSFPVPIDTALSAEHVRDGGMLMALAGCGLALGLADDLWHLGARLKFAVIALAALLFATFAAHATLLPITASIAITLTPLGAIIGTALWIFTITNTINFTDGANGLSMGSSAIGLTVLAVLCLIAGDLPLAVIALCVAASLVGFLFWNFPNGRIFAGDAGALFTGCCVGGVGAIAAEIGVAPWAIALCFLPQLADVLLTLAWRLSKKRNLLASHRDHLFQIGLRAGVSHARMAVLYWVMTAHCGICAIAGAALGPMAALVALAVNATIGVGLFVRARAFAAAHGHDQP